MKLSTILTTFVTLLSYAVASPDAVPAADAKTPKNVPPGPGPHLHLD